MMLSGEKGNFCIYKSKLISNIRKLIRHNDIAEYLLPPDANGELKINYDRLNNDNLTIYVMRYEGHLAGLAFFLEEADGKVRVDEGFFPEVRGKVAKMLASNTLNEYISDKKPHILKGEIVKKNKRALVFAGWMGFKVVKEDDHKFYVERQVQWAA